MSKSKVKKRGDPGVKCADLVDGQMRKTMDDLAYLWAARCMPTQTYESIGRLVKRVEEFSEKWPLRPRKGSRARRERDAEEAKIAESVEDLKDDEALVFRHFDEIDGRGQHEAFDQYGLCFGYVEFSEVHKYGDFFRWQLSWGGPSDEIQFYVTHRLELTKAMYRYMDWFDGAGVRLVGRDYKLAAQIWDYFRERGDVTECIRKYNEDSDDKPLQYIY